MSRRQCQVVAVVVSLFVFALVLAAGGGCQAISGFGRDVTAAADGLAGAHTADRNR